MIVPKKIRKGVKRREKIRRGKKDTLSKDEEKKIKKRLKALGYLE